MINLLATVKGAFIMGAVLISGGIVGAFSGLMADAINENTPITLAVMGVVGSGCWYLATTLQRLKDGQKTTNQRLTSIESFLHIKSFIDSKDETTTL